MVEEADVLLEYYDEADLRAEMSKDQIPAETFIRIYELAAERVLKEKKPIIIAMKLDKLLNNNPRFMERIGNTLSSILDKYRGITPFKENPSIVTIIVSDNILSELGKSFHRRVMHVEWEKPTRKEREKIVKYYDSSPSPVHIKLLAIATKNFSCAELERVVKDAQEFKKEDKKFPLIRSYWPKISIDMHFKKEYAFLRVATYAVLFLTVLHNKNVIKDKISNLIKKYFQ